jgi:hypothetical protein
LAISASFASAATYQYWNVSGTGGDGIWGTGPGDKNWNLAAGAALGNTTWPDPTDNIAVFQDALGGTITVFDPVQTNGLSQTGANYTLDASTITLVPDAAAAAPFVQVQAGTLTLNTTLDGTHGLLKTGGGTLLLANSNSYTGTTTVSAGSINLTGALASTTLGIAAGASLTDANGGLASATVLTNAGTLALGKNDTVASYISNGGTLAAGIRTLDVTSADLNDGSSIAGKLNGPTLTTNGAVSISGNTYCQTTNIASGTLTLTGTLGYAFLNIASGATLEDQSGGLLSRINVTNAGTLAVNAAQTIESYIQNSTGSLTGTAVLTVSDNVTPGIAITLNGGTVAGNLRGDTTSTGDVLVSGTLGGGSLGVTGGTLTLTGSSTNTPVTVALGAALVDQGNLSDIAALTTAGTLTVTTADTVGSLTNNAGTVDGTGILTVTGATIFTGGTLAAPLTLNGTGGGTFTNAILAGTFNGTAALDGATVPGTVSGNTTSAGNTLVSGSLGGGSLGVTGGTLTLTGTSTNTPVTVALGATLADHGNLSDTATLTNAGALTVNTADTIGSFTNNAGTVNGTGTLNVTGPTIFTGGTLAAPLTLNGTGGGAFTNAILAGTFNGTAALDGATVSGTLSGNTTSTGNTLVSGALGGGSLGVTGGTLTLTGTSTNTPVTVALGATLADQGNLSDTAAVTNAGTLTVNTADTIGSLTNNAGTVNGTGTLTVTGATIFTGGTLAAPLTLNGLGGGTFTNAILAGTFNGTAALDGATVSGSVIGNTTSTGNTLVSGALGGGSLDVTGGTLTLSGSAGNTPITIAAPATLLDANGGLAPAAAITNAGVLNLVADDTIASYLSNGGSLTGSGILTAGTATLNGGSSVSGNLAATTLTTHGLVALSGTATADTTTINPGTLTLTGKLLGPAVEIKSGATLLGVTGSLSTTAVLTNAGTVNPGGGLSVSSYISNGGTLAAGSGVLDARASNLNDGSSVAGSIKGVDVFTNGAVNIGGHITSSRVSVQSGTLTLDGVFVVLNVDVAAGASFSNNSGGLLSNSTLTNGGTLLMNSNDTITTYSSNSGSLTGMSTLVATTANLNNGSSISGNLFGSTLTTSGLVAVSGSATSNLINITSGTLTNTGTLGQTGTKLNITSGATLVAGGTQRYNLLTTSGPGAGTWQGNLTNPATVAPGGAGATGTLAVTGNFTNAPTGTLKLDLGTGVRDLVTVGGTATFGGTLDLNQLGVITPFVPVQVVAAGTYADNFTDLTENLDGAAWFNPANGTVMTLALPTAAGGGTLYGSTANQTAVWISLYDDVIAPGVANVTALPGGGYNLTSGIAATNNPDLLNALAASFGPGGLNTAVLDRLSPEVYVGFQDYAVQATRAHQRAALEAPALGFIQAPRSSQTAGSKHALPAPAAAKPWEYFAAVDYFDVETNNSPNRADYGINGFGIIAGARTALSDSIRVGGYVAADDGSVDGTLIDGDASGWSLGLFAKALVHAATHTLITGGISYGQYTFDGTRGSLIATGGGWTPAGAGFSGVDSDSLEFYVGASSLIYQTERFRLSPAIGLRYVCGNMDGFAETAGGPGSPIALAVDGDAYHSTIAELSLRAEADLTARFTAHGMVGVSAGINDDPAALTARFATGARPLRVTATGLDDDALFIGLGATWRVRDNIGLGLNWRADFRSGADMENTVGLSTGFQF